jgi:hypothetical protein
MNIQQRKEEALAVLNNDIKGMSNEEIRQKRKEEQLILSKMSEIVINSGEPLCDDFDLLIKSLIVDELLAIENSF